VVVVVAVTVETIEDALVPVPVLVGLAEASIIPGVGAGEDGNEAVSRSLL